jgi:hypothetical protein
MQHPQHHRQVGTSSTTCSIPNPIDRYKSTLTRTSSLHTPTCTHLRTHAHTHTCTYTHNKLTHTYTLTRTCRILPMPRPPTSNPPSTNTTVQALNHVSTWCAIPPLFSHTHSPWLSHCQRPVAPCSKTSKLLMAGRMNQVNKCKAPHRVCMQTRGCACRDMGV